MLVAYAHIFSKRDTLTKTVTKQKTNKKQLSLLHKASRSTTKNYMPWKSYSANTNTNNEQYVRHPYGISPFRTESLCVNT